MATYCGWSVGRFVTAARRVDDHLLTSSSEQGKRRVQFQVDDGSLHILEAASDEISAGAENVPILYTRVASKVDARLNDDRVLWSPMWTWISTSLAGFLLAVYGRALIVDPLSVIGFKSWRLTRDR